MVQKTTLQACAALVLLSACGQEDIDNGIANRPETVSNNIDKRPIDTQLIVNPVEFGTGTSIDVTARFEQPAALSGPPLCGQPDEHNYGLTVERLTEAKEVIPFDPPVVVSLPYKSVAAGSQGEVAFGKVAIPANFADYSINTGTVASGVNAGKPAFRKAPLLRVSAWFHQTYCRIVGNNKDTSEPEVKRESSDGQLVSRMFRYQCSADGTARCHYAPESS